MNDDCNDNQTVDITVSNYLCLQFFEILNIRGVVAPVSACWATQSALSGKHSIVQSTLCKCILLRFSPGHSAIVLTLARCLTFGGLSKRRKQRKPIWSGIVVVPMANQAAKQTSALKAGKTAVPCFHRHLPCLLESFELVFLFYFVFIPLNISRNLIRCSRFSRCTSPTGELQPHTTPPRSSRFPKLPHFDQPWI